MLTDKFPSVIQKVLAARRKACIDFTLSKVITTDKMKIIDIGYGVDSRSISAYVPENWEITGVDILPVE